MDKLICKVKCINNETWRKDKNGSWVYGYYVKAKDEYGDETTHAIFSTDCRYRGAAEYDYWNWYQVDPNTVCRYTGMNEFVMKDESICQPLFEGDIVEVWSRRRPPGENITLYRDNTTSKYDIEIKARAVIYFNCGEWRLDYDNAYNDSICELKGTEQIERTVKANPSLYGFGVHYDTHRDWFIEHNQHIKHYDIVRLGNIHDNPELLEG